jgi:glycogen debranching enzyme
VPQNFSLSTNTKLAAKRYVAAGDRAYVIGTADGKFPPMGWHIGGQMGGVWAHPIKLLNGYWFRLGKAWLPAAKKFTTGAGFVQMDFPGSNGLTVTRTEFSPDGIPAVLVRLSIKNSSHVDRAAALQMVVRSELMAAYPWGSSQPENAAAFNGHDRGAYDHHSGILTFREPGKPWFALIQSTVTPASGQHGDAIWGPVSPDDRATFSQYGASTGGELTWKLDVKAGGTHEIWIAIAGSHTSNFEASSALHQALRDPTSLLQEKIGERTKLLEQTQVSLPDKTLESAFQWGKLNLADLRRTVTDVRVRDTAVGTAYPNPIRTIPHLTGIGAGFPDYPWYFGTDGAYTVYALIASGQWDTAISHLRSIRELSEAVNGNTGKVLHEVVTDGSVYFGTNKDLGDTNETAQFAIAVDLLWKWTGDAAFRDEMYAFVKKGMHYITSSALDPDQDGWPEGLGIVERDGMGSAKLDVAAYTWLALRSLHEMAAAKNDSATAQWATKKTSDLASRFEREWWVSSQSLYADSVCSEGDALFGLAGCKARGEKIQQKYWIDAVPMEIGLASAAHAEKSLTRMESPTFTGPYGLYHTGRGGGPDGKGEPAIWTLPNSVMAMAEANYGRTDKALRYMDSIAKLVGMEMPGALPEIAPSPAYDPFQSLLTRAMFMQAWSSYGVQWPVIHSFLGIVPDVPGGHISVVPDIPPSWPGLSVRQLRVGNSMLAVSATRRGKELITRVQDSHPFELTIGQTLSPSAKFKSATLDGKPVVYKEVRGATGLRIVVESDTKRVRTLLLTVE